MRRREFRLAGRGLHEFDRRFRHLGIEALEDRLMLDGAPSSLSPAIVVGRTLSSYTVSGIQNHQETITYTVYNEQQTGLTGVLLTTTLQSGVTYATASLVPDQNGQNLAWSLGSIDGYGRASVSLTVSLASNTPLQLDGGARAYARLNADSVSNSTPAATLTTMTIPTGTLDSTPDANTTDPFIQEEAASLGYSTQNIFNFLHSQIGYNSYSGSVRGARGTLWSDAGNALDVASLGVALMRASGIPAQYVSGTLSEPEAQQLILSMFPASYQTVGYIPTGTATSNPADDSQLLTETEAHYWFQFNTGTGFQNADPLMAGATIGQTFTTATGTFTEVAQDLRETTEVQLQAEIYSQASAAFGLSGFNTSTVLDQTFNDVDLVGKPISVGNLVSTTEIGALIFSTTTNTYSPYIDIGDEANPGQDTLIDGTNYQEIYTSFPLGSQILTGLFLNITLSGPDGPTESYQSTLVDQIGEAARQGGTASNISVTPSTTPILSDTDIYTINALPGLQSPSVITPLIALNQQTDQQLSTLSASNDVSSAALDTSRVSTIYSQQLELTQFAVMSQEESANLQASNLVTAYFDRPSITIAGQNYDTTTEELDSSFNLRREEMTVLADPGQAISASQDFDYLKGLLDNVYETQVVPATPGGTLLGTIDILQQAVTEGIPFIGIDASNLSTLNNLNLSANVKALITSEVDAGDDVDTPEQNVTINGISTVSWLDVNPTTGEISGVLADGTRSDEFAEEAAVEATAAEEIAVVQEEVTQELTVAQQGEALLARLKNLPSNPADKISLRNLLAGYATGTVTSDAILTEVLKVAAALAVGALDLLIVGGDPPLDGSLTGLDYPIPDVMPNPVTTSFAIAPSLKGGPVVGSLGVSNLAVSGTIGLAWTSTAVNSFLASSVTAASATVLAPNGKVVGQGAVTLAAGMTSSASVSGGVTYAVHGDGSLSVYGPAETKLGVSGDWSSYSASVSGNVSINVSTDGLMLNGMTLPAGVYTIRTSSATLSGSGATSSPNFSGSVAIAVTSGILSLGSGTGNVSLGQQSITDDEGLTLSGFTGTLGVAASGNGTDSVSISGSTTNLLRVVSTPATLSTNQNTPVSFTPAVSTTFADTYTLTVLAPAGWTVTVDTTGKVTITPAGGTQAGTYPIDVTVQSTTDPDQIAQSVVEVTVTPTQPGVSLGVTSDTQLTVPFNNAQIPSAFRASIQNLGPVADTYNLTFSDVPSGFTIQNSGTSVTVPSGQTGILGLYLNPNAGSTLPAPGTVLTFQVTATSTTNPSITKTQVVTFTVPAIDAITIAGGPPTLSTTPGVGATDTITITNVGNVAETGITLASSLSTGLSLTGLSGLSLAVGQSATETIVVTPSTSTPLNSLLQATITATYGASAITQTLTLPVDVVVPGAVAIASAASAASQLGNTNLANRLNDLSTALTNLVQNPTSAVDRSQSVASLNAVIGLLGADPYLASLAPTLTNDSATLNAATTAQAVQAAVSTLGNDLGVIGQTLSDEVKYPFSLGFVFNTEVGQPQIATSYQVSLSNTGNQAVTYNLTISGLPAGVTGSLSQSTVTLQAGQTTTGTVGVAGLFVSLTSTSTTELAPFSFTVTAVPGGASELAQTITGDFTVRPALVQVISVTTYPTYANPGGQVDVTTRILNAVNQQSTAEVSYVVTNSQGTVLDTSPMVPTNLSVISSLLTLDLGSFDTTGFATGEDTITVTVYDASGHAISGATGTGTILIGSPVLDTFTTSTDQVPTGNAMVTDTLTVSLNPSLTTTSNLVGQLAPPDNAHTVDTYGNYAYVGGDGGINIVDISNPTNPTEIKTFGTTDIPSGYGAYVAVSGSYLYVNSSMTNGNPGSSLLIYSLSDPLNPTLVGQTSLGNDTLLRGLAPMVDAADHHVYLVSYWLRYYLSSGQIFEQHGQIISVDVRDPTNPVVDGVVYNLPPSDYPDGDSNVWQVAAVGSNTLYGASTTNTGSNLDGTGQLLVVDTTNPAAPNLVNSIDVPGTVGLIGVYQESPTRLVTLGTTGYFGSAPGFLLTGNLVVTTFDITNPQDPTIVASVPLDIPSTTAGGLLSIGNGKFVDQYETSDGQDVVAVIDPTDPTDPSVSTFPAPNRANAYNVSGHYLYITSPTGLQIYDLNGASPDTTVVAQVVVPKNSVVANSYNIAPTQIISGATTDTLVYDFSLSPEATSQTFTFTSSLIGLQPGESAFSATGGTIQFVNPSLAGSGGQLTLPPLLVTGDQIINIQPVTQTIAPGGSTTYSVGLINPTDAPVTYTLAVQGLPGSWVNLPTTVTIPADQTTSATLTLSPAASASLGDDGFTVTASDGSGATGSVAANLILAGTAILPDPQSHGIVVSISPAAATAGLGNPATYIVQLTNTGSAEETYALSTANLPSGVTAQFAQGTIEIPPGASNFRDVKLTLTPIAGFVGGSDRFTVNATSTSNPGVVGSASANLLMVTRGVSVTLSPGSVAPGSSLTLTVKNVGTATDTFNLALAGPAALVATLAESKVTLAAGASTTVTIATKAVDFAIQGGLELIATATSEANTAIVSQARSSLTIPATEGLTASFTPSSRIIPIPGTSSFMLIVNNTGNVEDAYSATIMGTNGPISAMLMGLDGTPASTIPIFRLPALSTGELEIETDLSAYGQGTFTVQIQSLNDSSRSTTATGTVIANASKVATATTLAVSPDPSSYGQSVTFTAIVSAASGSPSGSVSFTIDGVAEPAVGLQTVNGKLEASFSTRSLTAGSHSITAAYSGDSDFDPSQAATASLVVSRATSTTSLVSSATAVVVGQSVILSATVATVTGTTPTGLITFYIDGLAQTPVALQEIDGVATAQIDLASLGAGLHQIVANYAGSTEFAPSSSTPFGLTVTQMINTSVDGPKVVNLVRYGYHNLPTTYVITFDRPLNPATAKNISNYRIVGPDGKAIAIRSAAYNPTTGSVTITPVHSLNLHWLYQLTIVGTAPGGIADASGTLLDGANTGRPGSNFVATLKAADLIIGTNVPGGPAQLARLHSTLSKIEVDQSKKLLRHTAPPKPKANPTASATKAPSHKTVKLATDHPKATKKSDAPPSKGITTRVVAKVLNAVAASSASVPAHGRSGSPHSPRTSKRS